VQVLCGFILPFMEIILPNQDNSAFGYDLPIPGFSINAEKLI